MKKKTFTSIAAIFFLTVFLTKASEAFEDCSNLNEGRIVQESFFDAQAYLFAGLTWVPAGYFEKAGHLKEIDNGRLKIICLSGKVSVFAEGVIFSEFETDQETEKINAHYKIFLSEPNKVQMNISPRGIEISRKQKGKLISRVYQVDNGYEKSGLASLLTYLKTETKDNSYKTLFPFGKNILAAEFSPDGKPAFYKVAISSFDEFISSEAENSREEKIKSGRIMIRNGEIVSAEIVFGRFKVFLTKTSETSE